MEKEIWKGSVLLGPIPPVLVSCGTPQAPNVFTVAWAGIINTHPPRLSISVRPSRYSYELICKSGEFVVNLPTTALARAVDWCGVKSGRTENKFAQMGLTPLAASQVSCPLVGESPVNLECKVFQQIALGTHDLFLADIVAVQVSQSLLDPKGRLCLERADLLAYAHGEYYGLGQAMGTFGWSVRKQPAASGKRQPSAQGAAQGPKADAPARTQRSFAKRPKKHSGTQPGRTQHSGTQFAKSAKPKKAGRGRG